MNQRDWIHGFVVAVAFFSLPLCACQPNCWHLDYPDPAESPYALPYPPGESYVVSQSACNPLGGHRNRIAVDFMMPIGAEIVAARSGEVIEAVSGYVDGDLTRGRNNRILVRHEDGSIAWYAHLQHRSLGVEVGEVVDQGQMIARCGNTGNTGNLPHLHFEVFGEHAYEYADAIPVSFTNAEGHLDDRGGMIAGRSYRALAGGG